MDSAPAAQKPLGTEPPLSRPIPENADFAVVFDRHFDAIFTYLARRVGVSAAEDLASQTFVVAFERRETYESHPSGIRPWLYGIATNLISTHRRSEMRALRSIARQQASGVGTVDDVVEDMLDRSATRDEFRQLVEALADLSDELRDTLVLFAWADLTYEEISAALGIAPGTVGSRISRARLILSKRLLVAQGTPVDSEPWEREGRQK
jgi:RNA polymerase sigma-70 factor (ECF subfamily)